MAITFVNSGTTTGSNVTSVSVTKPSSTADNDIILIKFVAWGSSTNTTGTMTGFTGLDSFAGSQGAGRSYGSLYKVASGEPSSWTLTFSQACWSAVVVYVLRGEDTGTPIPNHSIRNDAGGFVTTLNPATATIQGSSDGTVYDYGGADSALSGAVTLTLPGTLSNTTQVTNSSLGGAIGVGWAVNQASPGTATSDTAIDYTDTFVDVALAPSTFLPYDLPHSPKHQTVMAM